MKKKFIYVDDEVLATVGPAFIEPMKKACPEIEIEYHGVDDWEKLVSMLVTAVNSKSVEGIILDWELNLKTYKKESGEIVKASYKAAEVAQYLRRAVADGDISLEVPIFVWSMANKLLSYQNDESSHDLFDKIFLKDGKDSVHKNPSWVGSYLTSYADAYKITENALNAKAFDCTVFMELLGLKNNNDYVDESVYDYFVSLNSTANVRNLVYFIDKHIVKKNGLLINAELLAVRLGIEVKKSPDWEAVLKLFNDYKYRGILSGTSDLYWANGIKEYWLSISPKHYDLSVIKAQKRVDILKDIKPFDIVPIQSTKQNPSERFWNICMVTKLPIDPEDSVMIRQPDPLPWQERSYISYYAAQNELGKRDNILPHIVERFRF